jgi:hypothetical protein
VNETRLGHPATNRAGQCALFAAKIKLRDRKIGVDLAANAK